MIHQLPIYLALISFIIILIMISNKIKVAYPIVLVLAGLAVSRIHGMPNIQISHELVFILFLPPLLYEAAWGASWKELWRFRRVISSFAFLIVILTSFIVAWVASNYIPGFTLALGFLLGGIVSPPDAVSASAIMKNVKISRHIKSIIEGESLLNDASSLIVFRFALIAVSTGRFVLHDAALNFVWVIAAGIAIGLILGYIFCFAHRWLPTDANMDIVLTLIAPYVMYIAAESIHVSGVLSVVSGGLYLSSRSAILSPTSRIKISGVWSALGFLLNGLVFLLIGLQLPNITANLEQTSIREAIWYGTLITLVLIVTRILCTLGTSVFTMFASKFITVAESRPGWRNPLIFGWSGMRGVVSLAAALSIPPLLKNGEPFPQRNLILFITFMVILLTLVIQGLTLPLLIRILNRKKQSNNDDYHQQNIDIHKRLAKESLQYLNQHYMTEMEQHPELRRLAFNYENTNAFAGNEEIFSRYKDIYVQLLAQQRGWLNEWNKNFEIDEEIIRNHLMRLDHDEERLRYI